MNVSATRVSPSHTVRCTRVGKQARPEQRPSGNVPTVVQGSPAHGDAFGNRTQVPPAPAFTTSPAGITSMTNPPVHRAGDQVYIEYTFRDQKGGLVDPSALPTLTLLNPDGTVAVNAANMTKNSVGIYSYLFQSAGGSQLGLYNGSASGAFSGATNISLVEPLFSLQVNA